MDPIIYQEAGLRPSHIKSLEELESGGDYDLSVSSVGPPRKKDKKTSILVCPFDYKSGDEINRDLYKYIVGVPNVRIGVTEENVELSDPYWERAVRGDIGGEGPAASILRDRHCINRDEEEYGYRWRKVLDLEPSHCHGTYSEIVPMSWDVKITPEGEESLTEFHGVGFAVNGFIPAFQYGSIKNDIYPFKTYSDNLRTFNRFITERDDKRTAHEMIGKYMAPLVGEDELMDRELVVAKPKRDSDGRGVEVIDPASAEFPADKVVEDFIPSKEIYTDGEAYDGCMRYVTLVHVSPEGVRVEDYGGYWRTASQPMNSSSSYNERFISNLSNGSAVTASFEDLSMAFDLSTDALEEIFMFYREYLEDLN